MADVTIGDETISVSIVKFKTLKKAWPTINAARQKGVAGDMMASIGTMLALIAEFGTPQRTVEQLEDALTSKQSTELAAFLRELLTEAGLLKPKGEEKAPEAAPAPENPSPVIATPL